MDNTPYLIEDKFYAQGIETFYTDIYKLLIDPDLELMTMEQRSKLLMFFMTLHCRTPKQFEVFFKTVPQENLYELDKIKEDYKVGHIRITAQKLVEVHEHKVIKILRITDGSEFITSDNPVLFVDTKENLVNLDYNRHFNIDNTILIPLDPKHCCVLQNCTDKNAIPLSSVDYFHQKIIRTDVDVFFTQQLNQYMLKSAEEAYYGREKNLRSLFNFYKLI